MRYYYKDGKGNKYSFNSEHNDLIPITEEEFNYNPAVSEKALPKLETQRIIAEKKKLLTKYREDVEQVDLFGMQRDDYEEKKLACKNLVLELRELEAQLNV